MPDFIVVGSDGTEHHFPEGMDPKSAIQVVRNAELKSANDKPLNEPTTKVAGMLKGFLDTYKLKTDPTKEAALLKGMNAYEPKVGPIEKSYDDFVSTPLAHPTGTMADEFLSPSALIAMGGMAMGSPAVRRMVGSGMESASDFDLTKPLKLMEKAGTALKASGQPPANDVPLYKVMDDMGNASPEASRQGGAPFQQPKPKAPAVGRLVKPPSLEDTLMEALQGARDTTDAPKASTASPEAETVGAGPTRQSGTFRRSEKLGQPGGYTSGRPSTSDALYNMASENLGVKPLPDDEMANPVGAGPSPEATLDEIVKGDVKKKLSAPEVADALRREYGSRDAGRMLYGDSLPGADRAEAIKRLAPGPSRVPNAAQDRIDAFNGKQAAASDKDPDILGLLVAALGGGALASRQTTSPLGTLQ